VRDADSSASRVWRKLFLFPRLAQLNRSSWSFPHVFRKNVSDASGPGRGIWRGLRYDAVAGTTRHSRGGSQHRRPSETPVKKSVVILGAGIAGMVAAWELKKAGYTCTILEHQSRRRRNWTIRTARASK